MKCEVYVDGSYMEQGDDKVYGSGFYLDATNLPEPVECSFGDRDPIFIGMRNVAGEIFAALRAMELIIELGFWDEVDLYYDYQGIESWVTGEWRAKNLATQAYRDVMRDRQKKIKINFHKVAGHTGVYGNERADKLARAGCNQTLRSAV